MANTIGRLKQGDLLIEGEVYERTLPITNGLTAYYPMDSDVADITLDYKPGTFTMTNRDWNGPIYKTQYNYANTQWLVTGKIRCVAAADWTIDIGIGFQWNINAVGSTAAYNWVKGQSWKCQDVKNWTDFSFIQTISSNCTYGLRPWAQINITAGTAGYQVEYMDVVYKPIFNTFTANNNNTLYNDGLCIEETTTNLMAGKAMSISAPNKGSDNTGNYFIKNTADAWYLGIGVPSITVTAGSTYAFSLEILADTSFSVRWDPNCTATNYTGNDAAITVKETSNVLYDTPGKWKKFWLTVTVAADATSPYIHHSFCPTDTPILGRKIYYRNTQLENKNFPTSYIDTTRGEGDFKLTGVLSPNKGTVVVEATFFEDNGTNGLQGSDQYSFGNQINFNSANCWWFHDVQTWYIYGSDGVRYAPNLMSPAMVRNERTHLVFVYDDSNGTMDIYKNGTLATNGAKISGMIGKLGSLGANWTHSGHATGTAYKMCQKIHTLAFYNRALTADEASKLYRKSLSISKGGNITSSVTEKPSFKDGAYFPLTINSSDYTYDITPITDTNCVYTSDGVYLDKGTKNVIVNPSGTIGAIPSTTTGWDTVLHADALDVSSWSNGYNSGVGTPGTGYHAKWVNEGIDGRPCIKFMDINSQFSYSGGGAMTHRWLGISQGIGTPTALGWASGDKVTISWLQKIDTPGKQCVPGIYHKSIANNGMGFWNSQITLTQKKIGVWERFSYTFTVDADWDLNTSCSFYVYGHYGTEGILWVDDIQVEESPYPNGFVEGTSGGSGLRYSLPFTPNMSFSFWHKLNNDLSSIVGQSTSPNLFEIGDYYANSSFTLWYWGGNNLKVYGRQDGASAWTISGYNLPGTYDQAYWNKWHNYTIVFNGSGSVITGVTVYIDGVNLYTNNALTITSWSGSFFGMGAYGGMYPNAIYRDLLYTQRALSATEVLDIYKTQMRAYKDNRIQIQGQIIEGQVI